MPTLTIVDKFGSNIERHEFNGTLSAWLVKNVPSYDPQKNIFTATLNGEHWEDYESTLLDGDSITITIEPKEPTTLLIVLTIASAAYSIYSINNLPQNYQGTASSGSSIYSPNAKANAVKPSGIVREIAGTVNIYPDLICPARRKYIDHEEYLYLMLCVGRGYFDLQESNIYISESSASYYSSDLLIDIFEPSDDVTGAEASENWYQTNEVSSLTLKTATDEIAGDWTVDASGDQFTFYLDAVATECPFVVDERFEMVGGTNEGYYQVTAISGASNEVAEVIGLVRSSGDTGRLEALTDTAFGQIGGAGRPQTITRNIFSSTGTPSLNTATGESVTVSGVSGGINWEGPFLAIPVNETTTQAEVDVVFAQGLTNLNNDGENINTTVEIAIEWRDYGTSTWNTVASTSYTAATYDERAYTVDIDFGSAIRPEFRFRRITTDADEISKSDVVQIRRVKCKLSSPSSYEGVTTIAMRLRGTNALAQTAENKINIRDASRKLPTLQEIQDQINGTPYDLRASATSGGQSWSLNDREFISNFSFLDYPPPQTSGKFAFSFSDDGLYLVAIDYSYIKLFSLGVAFDLSTLIYFNYLSTAHNGSDEIYDVQFCDSGNKLAYSYNDGVDNKIVMLSMSPAYLPTSATQISEYTFPRSTIRTQVSPDGTRIWGGGSSDINSYTMSTAFDFSTTSDDGISEFYGLTDGLKDFFIVNDGTKIYVSDTDSFNAGYDLDTPFDITTNNTRFYIGADYEKPWETIFVAEGKFFVSSSFSVDRSIYAYRLPILGDTRATSSAMRFAALSLYDAMGDEALDLIDWTQLAALDSTLDSRGDYLNAEFVDETTLWEALKIMINVGYCEPTIKEGKFFPFRESTTSLYQQLYTPDVMTDSGLQIDSAHYDPSEPDGIDVEYFSSVTNSNEVVECRLSGDLGARPKRIQAIGITDETKAWRYGMRERRRIAYKPASYTFTTEMDALNSEYGDPIAIASEIFSSQCGEVIAVDGLTVTLNFDPVFAAGDNYITFRRRDGGTGTLTIVTAGAQPNQVVIPSATVTMPTSGDPIFVSFGSADQWAVRGIVRRISPQSDNLVDVTADEYIADIYADDDNTPS